MSIVPPPDGIPDPNNNPGPNGQRWSGSGPDKQPPVAPPPVIPVDKKKVLGGNNDPTNPGLNGEFASVRNTVTYYSPSGQNSINTGIVIGGYILFAGALIFKNPVLLGAALTAINIRQTGPVLNSLAFANAEASPLQGDPLILDLDGDGSKTTTLQDGIFFDYDNNGFSEWTAWVDASDGILVNDLNNNGTIDNGTEVLGGGQHLTNNFNAYGYQALGAYDTNSDGVVNAQDQNFAQLKVLKGDGSLQTLSQLGIASVSLSQSGGLVVDENGNSRIATGTFTRTDLSTGQIADINFLLNTAISNPNTYVSVSSAIAALPDAMGSGNVYDLHQAMAMDSSGDLQDLVENFASATTEINRNSLLEQIIAKWAGVTPSLGVRPGGMVSDTHASVVEKFEGHPFWNVIAAGESPGNIIIGSAAGALVSQEYYQLTESLYGKLMAQTVLADYFEEITWTLDTVTETWSLNLDGATDKITALASTDLAAAKEIAVQFSRALVGLGWSSVSNYGDFYTDLISLDPGFKFVLDSAGKTYILGTSSAENIGSNGSGAWDTGSGQSSRDARAFYLDGAAGDDTLKGTYGADVLIGGTGNDTLIGYDGNDSYFFNLGDGQDTIIEGNAFQNVGNDSGYDSIFFGTGIAPTDLNYSLSGSNFIIGITGTSDQLTVSNASLDFLVEQLVFADGTVLKTTDILHTYLKEGTSGNDGLTVTGIFADIGQQVIGYAGNDTLNGGRGDDTLDGGEGNDTLSDNGGGENLFDGGNGNDWLGGAQDRDTLLGGDGNDSLYGMAGIDSLFGGAGDDSLYSGDGHDILTGGLGNDRLQGGNGNDTYRFEPDSGFDIIDEQDANGQDTVVFGSAINSTDAVFTADRDNNLVVGITGNPTDQVKILNQVANGRIETFHFNDSDLGAAQILGRLQTLGTANNDSLAGSGFAETLNGFAGNDVIGGYGGNDTVLGGDGNDTLGGMDGNDSLVGGAGNDTLDGSYDNDMLDGGIGDDSIRGGAGNDTLSGGAGSDNMTGDDGNDVYLFEAGFGLDTLDETVSTGNDTVSFGQGISLNDVVFTADYYNNLLVTFNTLPNDRLTIIGGVNGSMENFHFTDGDLSVSQALNQLQSLGTNGDDWLIGSSLSETLEGLGGNDYVAGMAGDDVVNGDDGNDTLSGRNGDDALFGGLGADSLMGDIGNDVLQGGSGNDFLNGGDGNDTYVFTANFGQDVIDEASYTGLDTISFSSGFNVSDAIFSGDYWNNLYIRFTGNSSDTVQVNGALTNSSVDSVHFDNGGNVSLSQVLAQLQVVGTTSDDYLYGSNFAETLTGSAGNDLLYGYGGDDTIQGGLGNDVLTAGGSNDFLVGESGNDTLYGDAGDDTFVFAKGDGQDYVYDGSGSDKLSFDGSISQSVVALFKDSVNHLQVGFTNSTGDLITFDNVSALDRIELDNGNYLNSSDISQIIQDMASYASNNGISLTSLNDVQNNQNLMNIVNSGWHAA